MLHASVAIGDNHYIQQWEPATAAARLALSVVAGDIGKISHDLDTKTFWLLMSVAPVVWSPIGASGRADAAVVRQMTKLRAANYSPTINIYNHQNFR